MIRDLAALVAYADAQDAGVKVEYLFYALVGLFLWLGVGGWLREARNKRRREKSGKP